MQWIYIICFALISAGLLALFSVRPGDFIDALFRSQRKAATLSDELNVLMGTPAKGFFNQDYKLKQILKGTGRSDRYEAVKRLTSRGIGQSTALGIGGDPIRGTGFVDALRLFEDDPDTYAVVMIGEIGGDGEEEAAEYIKTRMTKPVAAFISGQTAPMGKRMGHAGAIISGGKGTAAGKIAALEEAGVLVAPTPDRIGEMLEAAICRAGIFDACREEI